jgi:adenosylmethionine-8-amino-7-oxononanoate aminotransferase
MNTPDSPQSPRHAPLESPSTSELISWDREFLWHPFTPMKPWCENKEIVVIERGEGEFLIDTLGRRYIDGVSSLWCNVHGHNVPELNAAVIGQLQAIAHSTLLGLANVPSILLARRLIELIRSRGLALDKVFYSDNGSTAVEVACKMAFQYWANLGQPRQKFLAFGNAYHGDTLGAVSLGGIPLFHQTFKPLTFAVEFVAPPDSRDGGAAALAAMEGLLRQEPGAYAAIVVEPLVLGAGGMLMYPPAVLGRLRALADAHDTLLIFDEVLTGFGRTGTFFAAEHAPGVTPDFLCLSKGLTAGYMPLGVTVTTRKIFEAFYVDPNTAEGAAKTFFHGHTFTGHPLACSVALASLDLLERKDLLGHVRSMYPVLEEFLGRGRDSPFVADARRCGFIAAIDLAQPAADGQVSRPFPAAWRVAAELCTRMRGLGVMLRPLADTLVIMPPLAISRENLQYLCDTVLRSLTWIPEVVRGKEKSGG